MEDVFEVSGQGILAAIGASGVIGITMWLLFGTDGQDGPMGHYILTVLNSIMGA